MRGERIDGAFALELAGGGRERARRVLLATGMEYRPRLERRGLLVPAPLHQRSDLAEQLGAASAEPGPVVVDAVAVDARYGTSAAGVFAAGDVSVQMPQIAGAIAAGSMAAVMIVQSLTADDRGLPFPPAPTAALPAS